jgi:hypothetical protein
MSLEEMNVIWEEAKKYDPPASLKGINTPGESGKNITQ